MKISNYNISANASHSYSGSVDNVYTQKNKNEVADLSANSSVEDLVSISNAAREQDGEYWEERQNVKIQETSSLQQSNGSPQSSEVTIQKKTDPTPWHGNKSHYSPPSFMTPEGLIPELVVTGTHQTHSGITIAEMGVTYREPTEEELERMKEFDELQIKIEKGLTILGGFNPFNRLFIKTEKLELTEQTNVKMSADILSQDGRQIDVNLNLDLQQELSIKKGWVDAQTPNDALAYFTPDTRLDLENDPENTLSPLMFQLEPGTPEFSGKSFSLDLDGDGQAENLSIPDKGAGFLAFDANGDGQIQGTEIINGFDQLSAHDDDGNGWIDENDEIFQKLTIWNPDMKNENASGIGLLSADVGAIYLGSTKSSYTFRDEQGKEFAKLHSTGMFVRESGSAGHVFQMGVRKAGETAKEQNTPDYVDTNPVKDPIPDTSSQAASVPAQQGQESKPAQKPTPTEDKTSPAASQTAQSESKPPEETAVVDETANDKEDANSATEAQTQQSKSTEKSPDLTALNLSKNQESAQNTENINERKKQAEIIQQLQKNVTEKKTQLSDPI